mmetsp:Transcript_28234/g.38866  ORF Transcript_28234/g.38866 Transcript_28234/m.38866 type:complete len:136 (+) Transcript_28234:99-506(+)|eukprot:CAMPEP_0170084564 /NCGR_PEP_ID=MMETSP0019_2-20121128/19722_1 /TAXON_ID=98059 /ORGANISM="Dinobryon sp., Strain UTEXLB2267" /LENGTH=135 /DNA_ID=CAMNT_0010300701 /DNA_START=29 /DNA_END=436 /DNA_ORIENTATION=-
MKFTGNVVLLFICILCLGLSLKTSKPPVVKRQDLAHSIEIIKSDYDIPKANKAKIFDLPGKKLPNEIFGFTVASEKINGRLAMIGLASGLINEKLSGKSILEQIGISSHTQQAAFLVILGFLSVIVSIKFMRKED